MREMKLNAIMPSQGEKRFINLVEKSHKWIADKLLAHLHQGIFHIPKSTSDVFSPQYFWNQGNQQSTSLTPANNSPQYFLTLGFTSLCMSGGSGDMLAMNRILQESRPCSGYCMVSSILLEPALSCWASLLATCLLALTCCKMLYGEAHVGRNWGGFQPTALKELSEVCRGPNPANDHECWSLPGWALGWLQPWERPRARGSS